jgi:hypothetical protein
MLPQLAHKIAIRIEDADRWRVCFAKTFLPPGFSQ